jgi:ribosomal protein L31
MMLSSRTHDVYIGVYGRHTEITKGGQFLTNNIPIAYNDNLSIMPFCSTGEVELVHPLEKSLFILFQMRDASGKEVPKTSEGLEWGSDIKHFPLKPTRSNHDRMASWLARGSHTNGTAVLMNGPSLPSPNDLFVMNEGGLYYLTMEVHLMKQHVIPGGWTWDHIAIPAVTIKVERPLTAPFFVFSATNHGIYFAISGTKTKKAIAFDGNLNWHPYFTGTESFMLHTLDVSAGLKLRLWGPDGREISKTALGQTIGTNFDGVRTGENLPPGTEIAVLYFWSGEPAIVPAQPLPSVSDCFAMDKPGVYTLELQMQFLKVIGKTFLEPEHDELVRFPPMSIKVNRP